jgi:hypothetical protein
VNSAARVRRFLLRAFSVAMLGLLSMSSTAYAQTLAWNANTEPDLAGYIVQYGTQSGNPSTTIDVGNVTSRAITGLTPGTRYYFRVLAYNPSSQQSVPSTEISYTVPTVPPPAPTLTSVSPTSGPAAGGTTITLTGTNFVSGATVRVGGTAATNVTFVSATQLTARTPAGTAGARDVQVTNPDGQSATRTGGFTYGASAPTLTSVSPTSGPTAGGTIITLTGTSFVSGATVRVGGTAATNVTFVSATQVTARTPAGTAGARDVQITNPDGQSATRTGAFTYNTAAPTLTSVSPASGPTTGGTTITLTGTGFVSGATVRVGGNNATNVVFVSSTQLTARTPAGNAGARNVRVTNPDGRYATRSGAFTYTTVSTAPTLTAVSPASGPTAGGTTITLTGTNFVSGATVRVGGAAATNVTFVSATQLTARTPAGTAGARDVQVTNPDAQSATRTGAFTYTAPAAPALTSVSPTSGPTAGGTTITLTGSSFVSGATVRVGGTAATNVTFVSATQLTARTPAGTAGARDVQVTNPDGQSATRAGAFTYTAPSTTPTLTSVAPALGPQQGGVTITLTGTNFVSGATVRIGGTAATGVVFVSTTRLTALTPAGTQGARDVQVTNPDGQSVTLTGGYTYAAANTPFITSVTPASGPTTGGTLITIRGVSFTSRNMTIVIGGVPATSVVSTNNTTATAVTGAGTAGLKDIVVGNGWGLSSTYAGGFTYTSATQSTMTADTTRYLAEGVQSSQMNTSLAIANAETTDANVNLTFMTATGETSQVAVTVPARSRQTVDASSVPELAGTAFSTLLESDTPVALDRRVSLDSTGAAAIVTPAVAEASPTWYFAEGPTAGPFEQFYLVQNPGDADTQVEVRYLLPGRAEPVVRMHSVAAHSRTTIWVDQDAAELASTRVGAEIVSIDSTPIVVERTLYTTQAGAPQPQSGVTHAGAPSLDAPSDDVRRGGARWLVADAQRGVAVANQGAATQVTVTLLFEDGPEISSTMPVAAGGRLDVPIAKTFPTATGRRFSVLVEALDPAASLVVGAATRLK